MAATILSTLQAVSFRTVEETVVSQACRACVLDHETIEVWGMMLEGSRRCLDQCHRWLCDEERQRAARFVREEDRQRYILAHGSLRVLLGRHLDVNPGAVVFQRGAAGKPSLCERAHGREGLAFNLSHAHGRAVVALSKRREVGVDLEKIREEVDTAGLTGRYYALSEQKAVNEARDVDQAGTFFRYWVAKEAVLKAQGIGLSSLVQCEILLAVPGTRSSVRVPAGSPIQPDWTIQHLSCGAEWEGAVAAKGMDWRVCVRE